MYRFFWASQNTLTACSRMETGCVVSFGVFLVLTPFNLRKNDLGVVTGTATLKRKVDQQRVSWSTPPRPDVELKIWSSRSKIPHGHPRQHGFCVKGNCPSTSTHIWTSVSMDTPISGAVSLWIAINVTVPGPEMTLYSLASLPLARSCQQCSQQGRFPNCKTQF
jgi:Ni,Fe-hydrogenase III small subunit